MFRSIVSRSRRRYQDDVYDLDLTYIIQNRLIVMSYPAVGTIETTYRNNYETVSQMMKYILQVKQFLDERHKDKYFVFNVSEKQYDKRMFEGRVADFNWQDHHAPPFHLLFELVDQMKQWLERKWYFSFPNIFIPVDPTHIVVIHCMSGKGRAGTAACCLLLFTGFCKSIYQAAQLFSSRRFTDGKGIS